MAGQEGLVSVEVFAAKDSHGLPGGLFMAVSCKCGLWEADTLRIDALSMVALQRKSIMPIDLPALTVPVRDKLVAWAKTGQPLPVAEFMARGLYDAYYLDVVVAA